MDDLFEVKDVDTRFYNDFLRPFLPPEMMDVHTHVWLERHKTHASNEFARVVSWPARVAVENSAEDLISTYDMLFPGKRVTPLIFGSVGPGDDIGLANRYIQNCAAQYGFPALMFASPAMDALEFETGIVSGGFLGCKVYLSLSEPYIPEKEIRIFDFLPHLQLSVLNKHGWIAMLHIPRNGRLRDRVNLHQMLEIERRYPNVKLIIAHVGRAYCEEDVGDAFDMLSKTKHMMFDISANSNSVVFEKLIDAVGPKRILFGSDMPILRMRTRRICERGRYVNLIPRGLYGDISGDSHLREVDGETAESLTFFMYEEINAFRIASESAGLLKSDIEDVFYRNAKNMIDEIKGENYD